jgi:hypothetical protein
MIDGAQHKQEFRLCIQAGADAVEHRRGVLVRT